MTPIVDSIESVTSARFINRELSWLAFNNRVLAQAEDERLPLLERLKFCAIYASNLDEFFQVRVAGLKEQVAARISKTPPDGMSPRAQLAAIRQEVEAQAARLSAVHSRQLVPELSDEGVHILRVDQLDVEEAKKAKEEFENRIFPVLTPLAVDPSHPFPYISNLSLSLAVLVDDPEIESLRFARLKVPPFVSRFIELAPNRFVPVEQIIAANLDPLFPGVRVVGGWPFRVTRNADMTLDDEDADDLLEAIELELRRRRFGRAIRLELDGSMPLEAQDLLVRELDLGRDDVYSTEGPIDLTGYWQLMGLDRSDLKVTDTPAVIPRRLREIEDSRDFFSRVQRADIFVHHPYDSFSSSVSEFIRQASLDANVLAIKLTLYRTSGDSPIIGALIRAAERGIQVAALIELKARFDEAANIGWARRLEEAGVHVVYGLVGLKIHTKTALVVRDEPDGIRTYSHIGTGNYNPKTARIYEDVGVLTADPTVGDDLTQLFNFLTGYGREVTYDRLFVAPHSLREPLEHMIEGEMAAPAGTGRIIMKMNSLVDADIIERLYTASQAGVEIDLIIRGICCLRAGVEGLSENIRVRSIVGRYLEHSRLFFFANGGGPGVGHFFLGSADLMPRNLDRRVEVVFRVDDPDTQERLHQLLDMNLTDTALSWELDADDTYHRLGGSVNIHDEFEALALSRSSARTEGRAPEPIMTPSSDPAPSSLPVPQVPTVHRRDPEPDAVAVVEEPVEPLPPVEQLKSEPPGAQVVPEVEFAAVELIPAPGLGPVVAESEQAVAEPQEPEQEAKPIVAAGAMVYRLGAGGVEVLVARRPGYDDWSFPKGKREKGETDLQCAKRELDEETGFQGKVGPELPAIRYEVGGRPKTVRYWLMELAGGQFRPNNEVDRIRWLTAAQARSVLSYDHDRALLEFLPEEPTPTV